MCGTILWVGKHDDSTKYQLHALMTITIKKKNWNPWENCQKYALKLFWNAYTWHVLEDLIFYGQWTNLHDRSQNGQKHVTNDHVVWSLTFITQVSTNNIVMWETLPNNADWDGFKTPILQGDLEDSKSTSGGTLCVFGSHTFVPISWMCKKQTFSFAQFNRIRNHFFRCRIEVGWYHLKLDLWDLIVAVLGNTNQSNKARWDLCTNQRKFVQHLTQFRNESNLMEWSMIWTMLILFPQTSTLLIKKLCCMCLKTTKQWSRLL